MNDLLFNLCILLGAIVLIVSAFVYANWRSQYSVFETHTPLWVSIPFLDIVFRTYILFNLIEYR